MQPTDKLTIAGIGGISKVTGVVIIQIPFKDLGIVIDVTFVVLKGDIQTLLSMNDMLGSILYKFIRWAIY